MEQVSCVFRFVGVDPHIAPTEFYIRSANRTVVRGLAPTDAFGMQKEKAVIDRPFPFFFR